MEFLNLVNGADGQSAVVGQSQTVEKKSSNTLISVKNEEIHPLLSNQNKAV